MKGEPQKEHQWLQQLVGDWTYESDASMGPDKPSQKFRGTERVRSIGGLWIVAEGEGEMPGGGPAQMMLTLGYGPKKRKFVGTWLGSMMTDLWVYEGSLDEAGKVLTLATEGPDFSQEGKTAQYRERIDRGALAVEGRELIEAGTAGLEDAWLGLRTRTGVAIEKLSGRQAALAENWARRGWGESQGGVFRLTPEGWLLLDRLSVEMESA